MTCFEDHLKRQIAFSKGAFGPGPRTEGVIDHIRRELVEVEKAVTVDERVKEWVDVAILALDGLWRSVSERRKAYGYNDITDSVAEIAVGEIINKQNRNENRTWPDWRTAEPGKAIEHVRTEGGDT